MVAHELFQNKEQLQERRRRELISQIMLIWRENARTYRILPIKYQFLLAEKKSFCLGKRTNKKTYYLHRIRDSALREYPDIPFLKILHEEVAKAWLERLCMDDLKRMLNILEFDFKGNYTYNALKSWVTDATYVCKMTQEKSAEPSEKVPASQPGFA